MAIAQPGASDPLNSPAHHTLHCIIAADVTAPAQSLVVDSDGDVRTVAWYDYFATSTKVGWITPSGNIMIKKIGQTVFVAGYITGTSNDTVTTITVPYTIASPTIYAIGRATDNSGTSVPNVITIDNGATTITFYSTITTTAWTANGGKTILFQFFYEAA